MDSSLKKSSWWSSGCLALGVMGFILTCWLLSVGYMATLRMMGL
jgi:hypothetical protein